MNDNNVKCVVLMSHLTIGDREGHKEHKTYIKGDILEIPSELAKQLGSSITIQKEEVMEDIKTRGIKRKRN